MTGPLGHSLSSFLTVPLTVPYCTLLPLQDALGPSFPLSSLSPLLLLLRILTYLIGLLYLIHTYITYCTVWSVRPMVRLLMNDMEPLTKLGSISHGSLKNKDVSMVQ